MTDPTRGPSEHDPDAGRDAARSAERATRDLDRGGDAGWVGADAGTPEAGASAPGDARADREGEGLSLGGTDRSGSFAGDDGDPDGGAGGTGF